MVLNHAFLCFHFNQKKCLYLLESVLVFLQHQDWNAWITGSREKMKRFFFVSFRKEHLWAKFVSFALYIWCYKSFFNKLCWVKLWRKMDFESVFIPWMNTKVSAQRKKTRQVGRSLFEHAKIKIGLHLKYSQTHFFFFAVLLNILHA